MDSTQIELARLHLAASGDEEASFLDGVGDFVTKGVPLALGSGLVSMYNTVGSLGNVLGADINKIDYGAEVAAYDNDLSLYYKNHEQGVDLGGFISTSVIPGVTGIKALKMLQGGIAGKNAASVAGFFKTKNEFYTAKTLDKIRASRNEIFGALDKDKIAALAYGTGEQMLQGAAFETAVLLSMNQSPILAKEDENYITSLWRNSPDIFTAAAIQGGVGGLFTGLGQAGKFKQAVKARDIAQNPSTRRTYIGVSDIDPGTEIAASFSFLKTAEDLFKLRKQTGDLTDAEIINFENSIKRQKDYIELNFTTKLTKNADYPMGDGDLNNVVMKMVNGSGDSEETASLVFSAASKIERIATDAEPLGSVGEKVYTSEGQISERHAKNIVAYAKAKDKIWPNPVDAPTPELLTEMFALGKVLYRDSSDVYHVVEASDYAKKQLVRTFSKLNPNVIFKVQGQDAGKVTEHAYPTIGDIGLPTWDAKKGFLVKGDSYKLPDKFDPLVNTTLDSNAQFVAAKLRPIESMLEDGLLLIPEGNIPALEAVALKGFKDEFQYGKDVLQGNIMDRLLAEKTDAARAMIAQGKDFDFISRALNVTRDFAETQRGDGFLLSKFEDHTKPVFARAFYETKLLPNDFEIRGVASLMNRVQMAKENNAKVSASILGPDYDLLPSTNGAMLKVTTLPELGGIVAAASPELGTMGFISAQAGKVVNSAKRRRLTEVFQKTQAYDLRLKDDPEALTRLNLLYHKVLSSKENMFRVDTPEYGLMYVPESIYKILGREVNPELEDMLTKAIAEKRALKIDVSDPKQKLVDDYVANHMEMNSTRNVDREMVMSAMGKPATFKSDKIYFPPIDTRRYSYVAFVKERMQVGEGHLNEAGVIVAPTKEALEAKINQVKTAHGDKFEIFTKGDIETYKKIQGEWESGKFLNDSLPDSMLKREGILYEFQPRTDAEIIGDFNRWHYNQEEQLVRNAVELKYGQEFAELRAMGREFQAYAETKFGQKDRRSSALSNPYLKYIYTALDISTFDRYNSLWGKFNEAVEGVGVKMKGAWDNAFEKASKGEVSWVEANKVAESYGMTPPFKGVLESVVNPVIENKRVLEPFVAKVNGSISTLTLGLDFLNSLVNVISFPIMATSEMSNILRNIKDPNIVGALRELTSVAIPGSTQQMPSSMKLMTNSIARKFKDDGTLLNYYKSIGAIKDPLMMYKEVLDASIIPDAAAKTKEGFIAYANNLAKKAADYGKTATGFNKAEEMVRFYAADMMKQIVDIAGISASDAPAYINSFVNRVHGNYLASQRPHAFQGVVGQAISLFQTYQFNLAQNMVRYMGQDNKTAAAILLGLQNTIFGLQSNPAFYLLNQAVGSSNPEHVDLVTGTKSLVGSDISKWVLYGLGSNAIQTSLYNRGDLTPRYLTVVPTQIKDIPAISIPAKAISTFIDTAGNIVKGGDVKASLLDGLAHFGANRPLAGLAQLAQGFRTTGKGNLLTAYNDLDTMTIAAKLAGGEEINRAIATDAYFRNQAYQAKDRSTLEALGETVKTTMYKGGAPSEDQVHTFLSQYVRAGGSPITFNRWLQSRFKDANASQMNVLKRHLNTRAGRLQAQMMDADTQDFYFNPPTLE